jgi:hypothetical protein
MKSSLQLAMPAARATCLPVCYRQLQTIIVFLFYLGLKLVFLHSEKNTGLGA